MMIEAAMMAMRVGVIIQNSTKDCFAYFPFASKDGSPSKEISLNVDGNCNCGSRHRMGMMRILLPLWKEIPDAGRHSATFR